MGLSPGSCEGGGGGGGLKGGGILEVCLTLFTAGAVEKRLHFNDSKQRQLQQKKLLQFFSPSFR